MTFVAGSEAFVASPRFQVEPEKEKEKEGLSKTGVALIAVFSVVIVVALAFVAYKVREITWRAVCLLSVLRHFRHVKDSFTNNENRR